MSFTAKDVALLRERTSCGMMDCKKALTEAGGDMEKAVELLREKGLAAATKKAGRIAAEGVVAAVVKGQAGVIIEINAETDFVAKNDSFLSFVDLCAGLVIEKSPADVEALLALPAGNNLAVEDVQREKILTIGENIKIRRFERMEGCLASYIHGGGKIGVLVKFDTDLSAKDGFADYARDIAMQIAAINPTYLCRDDVPAAEVAHEKEILIAQIQGDPAMAQKPAAVIEKMVDGRLNKKFYQDACLLEQPFVKDGNLTVTQYTAQVAKELGGRIAIERFVRYERGEGIEKAQCDFASEVAGMIK